MRVARSLAGSAILLAVLVVAGGSAWAAEQGGKSASAQKLEVTYYFLPG